MGSKYVPPVVRGQFYDANSVSNETGLECQDISLTVQSERDDADINVIVQRFGLTGQLPDNVRMPVSGDFSEAHDFHTSLNMLKAAEASFMEFPWDVRKRFNHDPGEMIAFLENPENRSEAEKLGLVVPAPVPAAAESTAPAASPPPQA